MPTAAIAGAILEPFRGELFTATRGGGAWLGDERLTVSATRALDHALACTGVQSDDPAAIADFGRRIVALCTHCRGVRCVGSPALGLAYVAAGRFDAFVERDSTYAWDVGAGGLMITEAGRAHRGPRRRPAQPRPRGRQRAGHERPDPRSPCRRWCGERAKRAPERPSCGPAAASRTEPGLHHLGGIRIWAGSVSLSGTDPDQMSEVGRTSRTTVRSPRRQSPAAAVRHDRSRHRRCARRGPGAGRQ